MADSVAEDKSKKQSQATSCAECRRLKLRCDRVFPCSSCIRRGCANLCPDGTLEKGKRGFLKRLEQSLPSTMSKTPNSEGPQTEVAMFIERDAAMSRRIQELETALINAGVAVPGLSYAAAKRTRTTTGSNKRSRTSPTTDDPETPESTSSLAQSDSSADVTMGFGTLTIDPLNRAKYIGLSGASAFLSSDFWTSIEKGGQGTDHSEEGTADFALNSEIQLDLLSRLPVLPTHQEAIRLAGLYFSIGSYWYEVVSEEVFMKEHIPMVYERFTSPGGHIAPDLLSLVAMVLVLGQCCDVAQPIADLSSRVSQLFDLAVYATNISNTVNGATNPRTIQGIQALLLMANYQPYIRSTLGQEQAWQILGIVCRSLQGQGLHRDGARWGLSERDLEERRRVFWEAYAYDRLQSFALGRPYSLLDSHIDCEMPSTCNTSLASDKDEPNSFSHTRFHHYKFRWAILTGHIVDMAFSTKQLTYDMIKQVDMDVNNYYFSLPSWIVCPAVTRPIEDHVWKQVCTKVVSGPHLPVGLGKTEHVVRDARIYTLAKNIFVAILLLHRGPFCKALLLEPQELVRSPFESSVSRVTSAATSIINIARGLYVLHPAYSRLWDFLFHVFTAAICQAVFVSTAPFHPLAPQAFKSLQYALALFELSQKPAQKIAGERLKTIAQKAAAAMDKYMASSFAQTNKVKPRKHPNVRNVDSQVSPPIYPESFLRGTTEDLLGTSTKLFKTPAKFGSPMHFGCSGCPACRSSSTLQNQQPSQLSPPGWQSGSPDMFSHPSTNDYDPWFQTFMAMGADVNEVPDPATFNWNSQPPSNNSSQPQPQAQFDPNSFNDLDYTVDLSGMKEFQSLLEWRNTFGPNPNDPSIYGAANLFDTSNLMLEGIFNPFQPVYANGKQ